MSMIGPVQGGQMIWRSGQANPLQSVMNAASKTLGVSRQQLQSDLASGQSLSQIAQSQGMSVTDLVNGIVGALQSSGTTLPNAGASNLTQMVTDLVNATPNQQAGGGSAAGTGSASGPPLFVISDQSGTGSFLQDAMNAAAQTLNLSPQTLMSDLASGQSVAQIAQSQGVNATDLVNNIVSAVQSSGNASANAGASDLTQMVTDLVNSTPSMQNAIGNASATGSASGPSLMFLSGASGTPSFFPNIMNAAAQTLNQSPQTLMSDLASGQSLAQIAQSQGVNATDLVNGIVGALQSSGNAPANAGMSDLAQMVTNLVNSTPSQMYGGGNPFRVDVLG